MIRRISLLLVLLLNLLLVTVACHPTRVPTPVPTLPPAAVSTPTREPTPTPAATPTPDPLRVSAKDGMALDRFRPQDVFTLLFGQPMDPASAIDPLLFSPPVPGQAQWDDAQTTLTFVPEGGFTPGEIYSVMLSDQLKSVDGRSFDRPYEWEIEILPAPQIVQAFHNHWFLKERYPALRITFDRKMDRASVAAALTVTPTVPLALTWQEDVQASTLTITPTVPLIPGTDYQFTLDRAASADGVLLEKALSRHVRLDKLVSRLERAGSASDAPIRIHFNYAMDGGSVRRAIRFTPPIAGILGWSEAQAMAVFTPTIRLSSSTTYTLTFAEGLCDANGDPLPPPGSLQFTTPPPILVALPSGEDVNPATAIQVTFDRLMDRDTTASAFEISPQEAGRIEWRETTLIFHPEDGYLDENTRYTVTINTDAAGEDGESIVDREYSWTFRTGALQDVANFGWGPNAQVLDTDGRRAVQFQVFQEHPSDLTFELYRLSLDQFLDRYASGFRGVAGWESRPISTQGTTLVKAWQTQLSKSLNPYNSIHEITIPSDVPPGLYILDLVVGRINDQLILLLTRHTLVVKQAEGQLVAWVTDINDRPVPGIEVGVYARDGTLIASGPADEKGVYRTRVARDPQPLIVVARQGDDITASGLSDEWRSTNNSWWGWWAPVPAAKKYATHIFTDRPIYRPGQTVFYKAIVRQDDDALLSLIPEGTPVTVRIRDARNNAVQTFSLTSNAFGSVNGAFQLAEGAMLGEYAVEVILDSGQQNVESHRQAFKVEDYRKPDYRVTVSANARNYVIGEQVVVTVDSRYFFDEPVADADVTLNLYQAEEGYWWSDYGTDVWHWNGEPYMRARTDANGFFTFTLRAEMANSGEDDWWYESSLRRSTRAIEATVDDGSHQAVSGMAVFYVYNAAEKVSLDIGGYFKEPNQPFPVRASVVTLDDRPVNGRHLQLELRRYNLSSYRYDTVLQSAGMTTAADGTAQLFFTIEKPGYYQLYLSGQDGSGRSIRAMTWVCAFSRSAYADWYGQGGDLNIRAGRDRYAPGEVAQLLIESSFSGPALLTFERGTTRREQLIELTSPVTVIDVTIQPDDAPNIHVTVNAWKAQDTTFAEDIWYSLADSDLRTATVNLSVPVTDKALNVTIFPDRNSYAPRQEASFTIRVTDAQGQPVQAEVSLAMVDEAIFALSKELSGPIFDAFYHSRDNLVRTYDAMSPRRYLGAPGIGGGGGGIAGSPRSDFPDTAQWFPALQTDANGEVVVRFRLPDSLTSWRLTAKAVTVDTRVGQARANITTKQEIIVRPILPRTLTAGDVVQLSAVVHNYGGTARELAVSLHTTPVLELQYPVTQTIVLLPGEVRVVGWWAKVLAAGESQVVVRASAADGQSGDAVSVPLSVQPLAVPDVTTQIGEFTAGLVTTIQVPQDALGISTVHIELSRSIAGSMLQGLEYLTGFPYGCVEQTMSRALPNAVVGRVLHKLGTSSPVLVDLPAQINASLQRLYGYQHNDGGWGWWYDDATDAYQTAWVVFGLAVTAEAGYEVDDGVIERGVEWLEGELGGLDPRTRAFALYSMAVSGHGNLEATRSAAQQGSDLDSFSRAALALALHKLGARAEAEAMVGELIEDAVVNGELVSWTGDRYDGHYHQKTMSSHIRSTALALSALIQVRPRHLLEGDIVRWLMGQRHLDGWGSTNETAFALLALTDHLLAAREATADTGYNIELNGQIIATGTLGPGEPTVSLDIPIDRMAAGSNALHIRQSGGGRLYYVIGTRVYLAQQEIERAGAIRVTRAYLDPRTGNPVARVEPGQLIKVQLTVNMPAQGAYIIVEDRLPGGLEALNERLDTSSYVAKAYEEPRYYWREYGYNHKEVRADRVSFFYTELGRGSHTVTYMARATHAGEFVAMPVEVSAMYDMTVWGRSASSRLSVVQP